MRGCQTMLKTKLAQGVSSGSSPFRSDGSCDGQAEGWIALTVVKGAQRESQKITLGCQGTNLKQEQKQPNKGQLTLSQVMLKKGDNVADDDDDDKERTSVS